MANGLALSPSADVHVACPFEPYQTLRARDNRPAEISPWGVRTEAWARGERAANRLGWNMKFRYEERGAMECEGPTCRVFGKERVRKEAISPAELVAVDVEGDGGSDCLTREAGGTRQFGSLTTPRMRSRSTGWRLVMRRGDGGGLAMDHAKDIVHTRRRRVEGHASVLWVVVLVGVAECGMMGTCQPMSSPYMFPTSAQQYSIIPTAPIIHHRPPLYQQCPYAPMSI